jgi:two-component system, OmpR family, alkaline phosphatase synthesis response regulator PhoP
MNESRQTRILIIEDNAVFRNALKIRLEAALYMVLAAENGLEGLNAVRREMPDLVILDIMLPGLDGHKVCRMIKFDRKLSRIPVIVLTSRDLDQDATLAKQCGADAFVLKTTRPPILIEVIRKLLARKTETGRETPE